MPASEEESKAVIQAWTDWYTALGEAVIDPGDPFTPMVRLISSDGKFSASVPGQKASGYTIIKADSFDAAVANARGCPHLKAGGQVAVYETFNVM
jgi:hypothetical protein